MTVSVAEQLFAPSEQRGFAHFIRSLRPLVRDPLVAVSLIVILMIPLVALTAPLIAPYDPNEVDPSLALQGSSSSHWLGTDENGRDVLSRLIYGTRVTLSVGLISVGISMVLGVPLGLVAGYVGGFVDSLIMRVTDGVLAFPSLVLTLSIISVLGPGLVQIMVAVGLTSFPGYARITRAQVLSLREQEFVTAAVACGASTPRILFRHLLPNTLAPLIVQGSLGMAFAILTEAGLSFLGIGVRPPTATWGGMLQRALVRIYDAPYLSIYPGLAIFVVVLALNLFGDGLRDFLDPRMRGKQGARD